MSEHFNRLTPAEAERRALLAEEMGEAVQSIVKILRHGYESTHPDGGPTNRQSLEKELGDVHHAMTRLYFADDVDAASVSSHADAKAAKVGKYLHHQQEE